MDTTNNKVPKTSPRKYDSSLKGIESGFDEYKEFYNDEVKCKCGYSKIGITKDNWLICTDCGQGVIDFETTDDPSEIKITEWE